MVQSKLALVIVGGAAFCLAQPAAASVLIGQGLHQFSAGQQVEADSVNFMYGVAEAPFDPAFILFDLQNIDESIIGQPLIADAANTPDWEEAVALLTNGLNNQMYRSVQFPGGPGSIQGWASQSLVFFPSGGGPDFEGYTIHSIELVFLSFTIEFIDPWTMWNDVQLQVSVYGELIPAPGAALPLLLLIGAPRRRRMP